jgi:hypothetical protein
MADMYISLPSNSSLKYFKDNTMSNFSVMLPHTLRFHGPHEVALTELIFPYSYENVSYGELVMGIFPKLTTDALVLGPGSTSWPNMATHGGLPMHDEPDAKLVRFSHQSAGSSATDMSSQTSPAELDRNEPVDMPDGADDPKRQQPKKKRLSKSVKEPSKPDVKQVKKGKPVRNDGKTAQTASKRVETKVKQNGGAPKVKQTKAKQNKTPAKRKDQTAVAPDRHATPDKPVESPPRQTATSPPPNPNGPRVRELPSVVTFEAGSYAEPSAVEYAFEKLIGHRHIFLKYSEDRQRFKIGWAEDLIGNIWLSTKLAHMIGFGNGMGPVDLFKSDEAPYKPDFTGGHHALFVYSNIVDHMPVGDTMSPLLRIVVPSTATRDCMHSEKFIKPYYYPLGISTVGVINIRIRSIDGRSFPFLTGAGPVIAKVHIRPKRPF